MLIKKIVYQYSKIENNYNVLEKKTIRKLVISIPGAGCYWSNKNGGCYMCGFNNATKKYSRGKVLPAVIYIILIKLAWFYWRKENPQEIWIYNGGSFLNNREIPIKFQYWLCSWIAKISVKKVFFESRPEFVIKNRINVLNRKAGNKTIIIGIGLECANDEIRDQFINKGFTSKLYRKALKNAKEAGIEILTYVFLKPPYLSEKKSIEMAIETTKFAFENGSDYVALEAATVHPNTKISKLYYDNQYKPPWLWSVINVLKNIYNMGPIYVGQFDDIPPPLAVPENCQDCSGLSNQLIQKFREKYDINVFSLLNCECKKEWEKEILFN